MVPQIKKILYATDLSQNSAYAFYYAADLAQKHDAKILILHCIASIPPAVFYEDGIAGGEKFAKKIKKQEAEQDTSEIKQHLQEFCQKLTSQFGPTCSNLVADIIVREAYPAEEILNIAGSESCDVIVLGTHGRGFLKHSFLGTVAREVLERSPRPVFVVPLPSDKTAIDWPAV